MRKLLEPPARSTFRSQTEVRTTKPNINPHPQHPETNIVIAWKSTRHEMMPLTAFNDLMQHIANPMQFIQQST